MRILLVDDDDLVRDTLMEVLVDDGFDVIMAASGDEALSICAEGGFDILITDVRMPGATDGWDLAERCRTSSPALPVIYITGYSYLPPRPVPGGLLLKKPFRLSAIGEAIRGLIAPG